MTPLPTRKGRLWGTEYDVVPYLLDDQHGDGKQWIWFGYMDDRPNYYVARVDSAADMDTEGWYDDVLPWIEETIQYEAAEFMTDEQDDEWQATGCVTDRAWPVPPMGGSDGSAWGSYEPTDGNREAARGER